MSAVYRLVLDLQRDVVEHGRNTARLLETMSRKMFVSPQEWPVWYWLVQPSSSHKGAQSRQRTHAVLIRKPHQAPPSVR
jgi:hypothetical protein